MALIQGDGIKLRDLVLDIPINYGFIQVKPLEIGHGLTLFKHSWLFCRSVIDYSHAIVVLNFLFY
jgi:hypothetical protein